ncbi:MAG TPA: MFS transporter [Gammaproteobacteria bacterium]
MNRASPSLSPVIPWGSISALSTLLGLRMLGLFMVLPVLALHVREMPGATPLAAGLALGIYGLTQAVLQLPFGRLSDRFGRKPVIFFGLAVFAAGSVLAAVATTPAALILGRALQGAGAISSAVIALVGDLTPASRRTRVMALVGIVIGMAFILAFVVGPTVAGWIGVPGLFWLTAGFALLGALLLAPLAAPPAAPAEDLLPLRDVFPLAAPQAAGIFALHAIMTATFLAVPVLLAEGFGIPRGEHGWVYLPVMLGSLFLLVPLVLLQERRSPRLALALAVLAVTLGQGGLSAASSELAFFLSLAVFFGGFNFVEAQFPAAVSIAAGNRGRGSALGVYATAQFLGAFTGGILGGLLASEGGPVLVLAGNTVLAAVWLAVLFAARHFPGSSQGGRQLQ